MSLPARTPYIKRGDGGLILSDWSLAGFGDLSTDQGIFHATVADSGGSALVSLYSDADLASLVSQGTGSVPGAVSLTEQNSSGVSGSVYAQSATTASGIELTTMLCSERDLRDAETYIERLLLEGEQDFVSLIVRTGREFYTRVAAKIPPASAYDDTLSVPRRPTNMTGRSGEADYNSSLALWSLSPSNKWEITGLSNPSDFREWATYWTLGLIWRRRVQGADDGAMAIANGHFEEADRQWDMVDIWVDSDADGVPDARPEVRSLRIYPG